MRSFIMLMLIVFAIGTLIPLDGGPAEDTAVELPTITNFDDDFMPVNGILPNDAGGSRSSCGKYKFDDGWVQAFYSQVWAGRPRDQLICHSLNYEFTHSTKKNQAGKMVAAKVDPGCTCFFYTAACDPKLGYAESWQGWDGWGTWAYTDKPFKGWWCYEAY
ncbi:Nn.00g019700.m01.CDS01 [Neocucurbitaria sp. VM-36]